MENDSFPQKRIIWGNKRNAVGPVMLALSPEYPGSVQCVLAHYKRAGQLQGMTSARHLFLRCIIAAWLLGFAASGCQNSCPALQKGYEQGDQCREKSLNAERVAKSPTEQHFGI